MSQMPVLGLALQVGDSDLCGRGLVGLCDWDCTKLLWIKTAEAELRYQEDSEWRAWNQDLVPGRLSESHRAFGHEL